MIAIAESAVLQGQRGPVYGPLSFTIDEPFTAIIGRRGTGRTSLALSLAGRMRPSAGRLQVLDFDARHPSNAFRRAVGIVGFADIDSLEPQVSVAAILRERLNWASPWWRFAPRITAERLYDILLPVFGDQPQPEPSTLVRELTEQQEFLLRIALALTEQPQLLVIDDIDQVQDPVARANVLDRLGALVEQGLQVIAIASDIRDVSLGRTADIHAISLADHTDRVEAVSHRA